MSETESRPAAMDSGRACSGGTSVHANLPWRAQRSVTPAASQMRNPPLFSVYRRALSFQCVFRQSFSGVKIQADSFV